MILATGLLATAAAQPAADPTLPFIDKTGGYEMKLPAGWFYDRTGFFGPGNSLGLLRGVAPDRRTTCQILLFEKIKARSFPDWFEFFCAQLGGVTGVERVRAKGLGESPRPSGYARVEARDGANRIMTHYSCQAFDERTVWVFSLSSVSPSDGSELPAEDNQKEVQIPDELQRIFSTLRVFYSAARADELAQALKRGKDFIARLELQNRVRQLRIDENVRYYDLALGGKRIGYLTRQFTREQRGLDDPRFGKSGKEGLRVREESWRFADDGSSRFTQIDMFSSVDGATDLFESNEIAVPSEKSPDQRSVTFRDQCVREDEVLFATYFSSLDADRPDPRRPLKIDAAFLGLAWARLLPPLLGRESADATAFTIYDSETRALITHTLRPKGELACPQSAESPTYQYEIVEGMLETPTRIWTDKRGHMLRVEAGDLVVKIADKAEIDQTYGPRRDAAQQRLRRPPPQPATPAGR